MVRHVTLLVVDDICLQRRYLVYSTMMTSSQSSVSELVTIDQAQQIVRAHLAGHDQSIVKSLSQIENKGYR